MGVLRGCVPLAGCKGRAHTRLPLRADQRCGRRSARVEPNDVKRRNPWEKSPFLPCLYGVYISSRLYTKSTTFSSQISDMHALCKSKLSRWQFYKEATSKQFFINLCKTLIRFPCRIHTTPQQLSINFKPNMHTIVPLTSAIYNDITQVCNYWQRWMANTRIANWGKITRTASPAWWLLIYSASVETNSKYLFTRDICSSTPGWYTDTR